MCMSRRHFLGSAAGGFASFALSWNVADLFAQDGAAKSKAKRCIALWMDGGPSQLDTFDPKPGRPNGGEFKSIETASKEIQICEHLPQLARWMDRLSIVRTVHSPEADHVRGAYVMHTGYVLRGSIDYPSLGSLLSYETTDNSLVPSYVSIKNELAFFNVQGFGMGPGFLGQDYAPFMVDDPRNPGESMKVLNTRTQRRFELLRELDERFEANHEGSDLEKRKLFKRQAEAMRGSPFVQALDLSGEKAETLARYVGGNTGEINYFGRRMAANQFGHGCLVARRLLERGARFVEVNLGGWDTHANNFASLRPLLSILDAGFSGLMADLAERGMLDSTLILWMGEFGRTPVINRGSGRDHHNKSFAAVLGGGGIQGGRVIGDTGPDGLEAVRDPVSVPDLFATVASAFGVDPVKKNYTPQTGVVKFTDNGKPIRALLA
ncbi:MAG TPA: DUF1501 domain-containing protein [Planctomycetota bacterium]|nr:DUF1501 domain-containing protein [Planctomycetota bacterium]